MAALLVTVAAAACAGPSQPDPLDRLHPCRGDEGPNDAFCGSLPVFENRASRQARRITLRIVVLPALSNDARPDPLFFLAGGPGQGAAELAPQIAGAFRRIQENRDIVLIDQRGTGKSHPLNCRPTGDSLRELNEPDEVGLDRLRACLKAYDADPRFYTTTIAMDDLDQVREHLGYRAINLYGGSYGTRAALEYLRRHEDRVRSVILDSVAPPDMRLPLFAARDAQRALDRLLADCAASAPCSQQYPRLDQRLRALLARLEQQPARVTLVHPRTGVAEQIDVDARHVVSTLFGALYSPLASSLLPALIDRAERDDFQGMLAIAFLNEAGLENMSAGMQLSVLCAEDAPRVSRADVERESAGTVFGDRLMTMIRACEFWPRGDVDPKFYEPVVSNVPTLVLSGELDPVTPPSWGEAVASHLPRATHYIVPGAGHGAAGAGCGMRLVHDFLESADARGLNPGCLNDVRRPPFFLTPSGPDPSPAVGGARR